MKQKQNYYVASVDEDGTIHPMNQLWLDNKDATSLLLWMKQLDDPQRFKILDMGDVDLTKLCLNGYVPEAQEQIIKSFKLEISRKLALDKIMD